MLNIDIYLKSGTKINVNNSDKEAVDIGKEIGKILNDRNFLMMDCNGGAVLINNYEVEYITVAEVSQ